MTPHTWIANMGRGGEPVFSRDSRFGVEYVMQVSCCECGTVAYITRDKWDSMREAVEPSGECQ